MADVTKVLLDDHARLRRMFMAFSWGTYDQALSICDELIIGTTIKEELIYPVVREEIDARLAEEAEENNEDAKRLMGDLFETSPDDPQLASRVEKLKDVVFRNMQHEEKTLFPRINTAFKDELYEMGNQVFALRQELLAIKPERTPSRTTILTANTGWGKQGWGAGGPRRKSETANLGW